MAEERRRVGVRMEAQEAHREWGPSPRTPWETGGRGNVVVIHGVVVDVVVVVNVMVVDGIVQIASTAIPTSQDRGRRRGRPRGSAAAGGPRGAGRGRDHDLGLNRRPVDADAAAEDAVGLQPHVGPHQIPAFLCQDVLHYLDDALVGEGNARRRPPGFEVDRRTLAAAVPVMPQQEAHGVHDVISQAAPELVLGLGPVALPRELNEQVQEVALRVPGYEVLHLLWVDILECTGTIYGASYDTTLDHVVDSTGWGGSAPREK